jgi:aminobenzoyl-glutamate utilization protein A
LHQIGELGWCEYQTTYYLYKQLLSSSFELFLGSEVMSKEARMGVPSAETDRSFFQKAKEAGVPDDFLEKVKGGLTGLVAVLDTKQEGPHFGFRFDIDALPIIEDDDSSHAPAKEGFSSQHRGTMHACAHDGHAAIGLGLACFVEENKDKLTGKYTFIFQPAEEGSRGAKAIVDKGWLDDVDYFLSGHIGVEDLAVGTISATTTQFLATTKLDVTFEGVSAHAGKKPHEGKNALLAAAEAALALQGITRHGDGTTRVNVGKLVSGSGRNIVAEQAFMEVETRGSTTDLNKYMVTEAIRKIKAAALSYDVTEKVDIVGEGIAVNSNKEWIEEVKAATEGSAFVSNVIDEAPIGASEDVAYMMKRVQDQGGLATYLLYGTPLQHGHHHKAFDFDERVLTVAVNVLMNVIAKKGCFR